MIRIHFSSNRPPTPNKPQLGQQRCWKWSVRKRFLYTLAHCIAYFIPEGRWDNYGRYICPLLEAFPGLNNLFSLVGVDGFLTYRAIQNSPPLSKRLNCVLISRCEYPSRNPSSPLDCRAADRFAPPPPPRPARTICYIFSPLLSLFTQADVHGTATQARATGEEESEARRANRLTAGTGETTRRRIRLCLGTGEPDWMVDFFILWIWIGG